LLILKPLTAEADFYHEMVACMGYPVRDFFFLQIRVSPMTTSNLYLALRSAHTRPSAQALINTSGNFFGASVRSNFLPFQVILSPFHFFSEIKEISEPYDNSFWEKSNLAERKKEERKEITPLIVDT
jgi:hypothetical protein